MNFTVMNKSRTTGWFMVTITILLYILTITNYGISWYYRYSLFITHGQSFWTSYLADTDTYTTFILLSVTSIICTMLADIIMVYIINISFFTITADCYLNCRSGVVGLSGEGEH